MIAARLLISFGVAFVVSLLLKPKRRIGGADADSDDDDAKDEFRNPKLISQFLDTKAAYYRNFDTKETRRGNVVAFQVRDAAMMFFQSVFVLDSPSSAAGVGDDLAAVVEDHMRGQSSIMMTTIAPSVSDAVRNEAIDALARTASVAQVGVRGEPESGVMAIRLDESHDTVSELGARAKARGVTLLELAPDASAAQWRQLSRCVAESFTSLSWIDKQTGIEESLNQLFRVGAPIGDRVRALLALDSESRALGCILIALSPAAPSRELRVGSFFLLGVVPEARGLGLGKLLSLRALATLRSTAHTHCVIEASPEGAPVYLSLGFRRLRAPDTLINVSGGRKLPLWMRALGVVGQRVVGVNKHAPFSPQRALLFPASAFIVTFGVVSLAL